MNVKSKDTISITSDKDLTIESERRDHREGREGQALETSGGSISEKASKDVAIEASSGAVKIKGGSR